MSEHDDDLVLRRLRGLAILEPESTRIERVRRRCHDVLTARQRPLRSSRAAGRFRALGLGVVATLAAGLVAGIIQDLVRVYLRL